MRAGYSRNGNHHPLAELRATRRMSTRRLSALSGVSHVTITKIENGRTDPRQETKESLAAALGVPVELIWGDGAEPVFQEHPDEDPSEPDLRPVGPIGDVVVYMERPRVDYLDEAGRVVATQ